MANDPENKHGVWAKVFLELYKVAVKEFGSPPGRVNILMVIGLIAIIVVYALTNTVTSVARIVASVWNPEFVGQTGDNIIKLIIIFVIATGLCLVFMRFIIKEEDED